METPIAVNFIWLIPFFPLVGAFLNASVGWWLQRKYGRWINGVIANASVWASFLVAVSYFLMLTHEEPERRALENLLYTWISAGGFKVTFAFAIDPLSSLMSLIVTGVGGLIHLYSVGYMSHEKSVWRYFSYLNLFTAAMLTLVLGDNLLLMFVGWEGVGLCSYLLIGFWYTDIEKAKAGMKAFIVNRVGDFGFLAGMMLLLWGLGGYWSDEGTYQVVTRDISLQFRWLAGAVGALEGQQVLGMSLATAICLCLFVGATGKSAQIPLFVWLPDAMAGPTPVSALIHAATMVTAGVYMIARLNFLFVLSPAALTVVSGVGAATALFAASIGFAQRDIKKVLAYSTVSQLGFMFIGVGVGAFTAGVFHLMTHAFFKACLFLGSGSVIHAMGGEQDVFKMGGLRKYMKYTFWTFFISTLAITGIPGLAGFFSKDEILWKAFDTANPVVWWWPYLIWGLGATAAFCTSFYMFRLVYLTFLGPYRGGLIKPHHDDHDAHAPAAHGAGHGHDHPKHDSHGHHDEGHLPEESPFTMTIPLMVLALLALVGGYLGLPALFGPNLLEHWLEPVFEKSAGLIHSREAGHGAELGLMGLSVGLAVVGWFAAHTIYKGGNLETARRIRDRISLIEWVVSSKYFVDEIYHFIFVKNFHRVSGASSWFDRNIIDATVNLVGRATVLFSWLDGAIDKYVVDGMVNLVAGTVMFTGRHVKRIQTGRLQDYLYVMVTGIIVAVVVSALVTSSGG